MSIYKITLVASFLEIENQHTWETTLSLWAPMGTAHKLLGKGIGEPEFIIYESLYKAHVFY